MEDHLPLRVAHVVASIDNPAAGPSYSVPRLAAAQAEAGVQTDLSAIGAPGVSIEGALTTQRFATDFRHLPLLRDLALSCAMRKTLIAQARTHDIIHNHGLWLAPNILSGWAVRKAGARAKFVCAPRGMLGAPALAFSKRKKQLMWAAAQGAVARQVDCWHATAMSEYDDIRSAGLNQPVAIIPNGIDLPTLHARAPSAERTVLSLGRIHPKKGLDTLLHAWSRLELAHTNWRLDIIGPSELNHDVELRALAAELSLARVYIGGPLFGDDKIRAMAAADLFVLPTRHENFAMTVAEALAAGTPVVCSKGAPWAELQTERCGWWVDYGAESLAGAMSSAMALPSLELAAMGERGRAWMERDFSWARAAQQSLDAYSWILLGGDPPAHVVLN